MPSLRFSRAAIILILAALLTGCGELAPPAATKPTTNYATYHTVRSGDTLYSIAWRYGYDYREVAAWNHIGAPYRIHVGQRLLVTPTAAVVAGRSTETPPAPAPRPATSPAPAPGARAGSTAPAPKTTPSVPVEKPVVRPHQGSGKWQWPAAGSLKRRFNDSASKKGLNIAGRVGQPVYAAAGGDVVYSGSGLVGYGNLVIIKHDDVFLSAYGYNRRLLVKEGEKVKPGQMIAEMGETAKDGALLHFEIRQEGKPVDPLRYLPPQNR